MKLSMVKFGGKSVSKTTQQRTNPGLESCSERSVLGHLRIFHLCRDDSANVSYSGILRDPLRSQRHGYDFHNHFDRLHPLPVD